MWTPWLTEPPPESPSPDSDPDVWVCHCRAVTDRQITTVIEQGACDEVDVGLACGAGTRCGGCVDEVRRLCEQVRLTIPRDSLLVGSAAH